MIKIIEELTATSKHLHAALERYISACSAIQHCYVQGNNINSASQELSSCVRNELLRVTPYETTVKRAKASICLSRNRWSNVVPISVLPSEILEHIFQLVVDARPCTFRKIGSLERTPATYPELLSHVCTLWRQIVNGSHALWSHVDVVPRRSFTDEFLARVARTGHSFLDIHITDVGRDGSGETESDYAALVPLLAPIGARIKSFTLQTALPYSVFANCHSLILQSCLPNCTPGALTKLAILSGCTRRDVLKFIGATGDLNSGENLLLDMPHKQLEDLWLPVDVLRLRDLYPPWTSKAYHGLVELRLTSRHAPTVTIPESQLVSILRSSPGLHTFHFSLVVTDSFPEDTLVVPIHLKDLKELVWKSGWPGGQLRAFLRWIAPGPNPLRVSIQGLPTRVSASDLLMDEAKMFFARSNISRVYLGLASIHYSHIAELLDLWPNLRFLGVGTIAREPANQVTLPYLSNPSSGSLSAYPPLDTLHLLHHSLYLDELLQMVERHSVKRLILWGCKVRPNSRSPLTYLSMQEVGEKLSLICPASKCIGEDEPHPAEWEFLSDIQSCI